VYRNNPEFIPGGSFLPMTGVEKWSMTKRPSNKDSTEIDSSEYAAQRRLFFAAAEHLSNEPCAIVWLCADAAVCTSKSYKRNKAGSDPWENARRLGRGINASRTVLYSQSPPLMVRPLERKQRGIFVVLTAETNK
jgi:hypothetical protein